ncbi:MULTISPECIES: DEAD/DEAH box helicase [unclassified Pseudoalteromonas]|uniref:DEAD/DEAH box helicase n=1 Tax=unclassified Pseudoalteromonas TaxID=194690 RepID=UPI0005A6EBAE|nr:MULTISPECIES: DEAD/DEAH box helicase [unclassified Pseudoalteromonas]
MSKGLTKTDLIALFDEIKKEQEVAFPITEGFLKRYFKPAVFEKAKQCLTKDLVNWVESDDKFTQVSAEVYSESGDIFHQHIQIKKSHADLSISGLCSCKIGKKCHHIGAALLKLKTQHSGLFGKHYLLHDWFNQLEQLKKQRQTTKKDVILFVIEKHDNGLVLVPKQSSPISNGRYSQGRPLTKQQLNSLVTPEHINESDFRLLSWIRSQNSFGQLVLENRWGVMALVQMVATGRCFWQDSRQAIRLSAQRPLDISWRETDTIHELNLSLPQCDKWQVFNTTPPYYIDINNFEIGELETSLTAAEVSHLFTIPPVADEMFDHVNQQFKRIFGSALIQKSESKALTSEDVVPRLSLVKHEDRSLFHLQFAYGKKIHELNLDEQQDAQIKTAFEDTCLNRLQNCGLILSKGPVEKACYLTFNASDESSPQHHWFVNEVCKQLSDESWVINTKAYTDPDIILTPLILAMTRSRINKLSVAPYFDISDKTVYLSDLLTSAALCNNKSHLFNYYKYQDTWLAVHKPDINCIFDLLAQFYANKTVPKRLSLPLSYASSFSDFDDSQIDCADKALLELITQVSNPDFHDSLVIPKGLNATLRDYQKQAVNWLQFLRKHQLGGILADDMGLGKTLQTIAFLLSQKETTGLKSPALIICPTSLVSNWVKEINRFAPDLNVLVSHGASRKNIFNQISSADCVITTYPLITRDNTVYEELHFSHVILDEAQTIKNNQAKISRAVKALSSDFNLCLTGTPVENNLKELKSLLDFAMPGLIGSMAQFKTYYQVPIEKEHNEHRAEQLKNLVLPFVLRRTKEQVLTELPAKTELVRMIELAPKQQMVYQGIRANMEQKIKELFKEQGADKSRFAFLEALLRLRQACCDPRLVNGAEDLEQQDLLPNTSNTADSAKLTWLCENIPLMLAKGRKIIIFSQFTSMLSIIEQELVELNVKYSILTGKTKDRDEVVNSFQNGDNPIFLISLKAGGTGLNLTKADTVIHYDPWWNPAVERQATDRAHRIGQLKPVFVYKLICQNSIEERVFQMQQDKAELADSFFDAKGGKFNTQTEDQMLNLLSENN